MALIVKSPRLFASIDREGVTPESLNPLLVKLRQPARDLHKFDLALQHSLLCITLRQVKDSTIVGFLDASTQSAPEGVLHPLHVRLGSPDASWRPVLCSLRR